MFNQGKGLTSIVLLLVGLCIALGILLISEQAHTRLAKVNQGFVESIEAKGLLRELNGTVSDAQAGMRAYYLTRRTEYLRNRYMAPSRSEQIVKRLEEIWRNEPEQLQRLRRLSGLLLQEWAIMTDTQAEFDQGGRQPELAADGVNRADELGERLRREIEVALASEADTYRERVWSWQSSVTSNRIGIWVISAINLVLVLLLFARARYQMGRDAEAAFLQANHHAELELQVERRTLVLSELASSLQIEQERDRAKIAREIRNTLGELNVHARMLAKETLGRLGAEADEAVLAPLNEIVQQLDRSLLIKQRLIEELHPSALDQQDLVLALRVQIEQSCAGRGMEAVVTLPESLPNMPEDVRIALFRICQQALGNIVQHAKASKLWLALEEDVDGWLMRIEDNGIGLTVDAQSPSSTRGMALMNQRAIILLGQFEVRERPEGGTVVEVWLPKRRVQVQSLS